MVIELIAQVVFCNVLLSVCSELQVLMMISLFKW